MFGKIEHYFDANEVEIEDDETWKDDDGNVTYDGKILKNRIDLDKHSGESLELHWNEDNLQVWCAGLTITVPLGRVQQYGEIPRNDYIEPEDFTIEELIELLEVKMDELDMKHSLELKTE